MKPFHIRRVHDAILKAGRSTGLALNVHWCMSADMKAAMYEDLIPKNPVERTKPPRTIRQTRTALTNAQAKHLLQSCIDHNDPLTTRWAAALLLGGRQGELLGLSWDRVNFEQGTLNLEWALDVLPVRHDCGRRDPDGNYPCGFKWATRCPGVTFDVPAWFTHIPLYRNMGLVRPKTKKSQRIIPLPLPLAALLKRYKQASPTSSTSCGPPPAEIRSTTRRISRPGRRQSRAPAAYPTSCCTKPGTRPHHYCWRLTCPKK